MVVDSDSLNQTLDETSLTLAGYTKYEGKVRDCYIGNGQRILVTTDRISAFDRVLGTIPFKGQVLNRCAMFAFKQTVDIARNHVIDNPDPNVVVAHECTPIMLEFVVRAYLTGVTSTSVWTHYQAGARAFAGHALRDGLKKNEALPKAIVTPSTKAEKGGHDETISRDQALARNLITPERYDECEQLVIKLFARGQQIAAERGLILADTKYELGLLDGALVIMDEIHTPDSSRYWFAESYEKRLRAAQEPESFDKEYVRRYLADVGYRGDGPPPMLPDDVRITAAQKYIQACEMVTGATFIANREAPQARVERAVLDYVALRG